MTDRLDRSRADDDIRPTITQEQKDALKDEWGRGLAIEADGDGVVLRSAGADGDFHTRDDWTLEL